MADKALHSRRVIVNGDVIDATVFITGQKISGIEKGSPQNYSGRIIDVGNKIIMAGILDPHVHINEPGRTEWEGFDTATKANIGM